MYSDKMVTHVHNWFNHELLFFAQICLMIPLNVTSIKYNLKSLSNLDEE